MSSQPSEDDMAFTFKMKDVILFTWMFLLFIFSWISVAVVGRAVDNITFSTLGLSDKSTLHTVVIALVIITIEVLTLYYFNHLGIDLYGDSMIPKSSTNSTDKTTTSSSDKTTSSENSTPLKNTGIKIPYHVNQKYFLDSMSGISMIAEIEGIMII